MNIETNSPAEVLFYAIGECLTQRDVTLCALQIHQVCPPGSEIEGELITRVAAKQIALDLEAMECRRNSNN